MTVTEGAGWGIQDRVNHSETSGTINIDFNAGSYHVCDTAFTGSVVLNIVNPADTAKGLSGTIVVVNSATYTVTVESDGLESAIRFVNNDGGPTAEAELTYHLYFTGITSPEHEWLAEGFSFAAP